MHCQQAFKSYDEAGAARRVQCLKYLVLANMLMQSSVDPFDAQEAKPYKNDPQVLAMTDLVQAYQRNDIMGFERILRTNRWLLKPTIGSLKGLFLVLFCWFLDRLVMLRGRERNVRSYRQQRSARVAVDPHKTCKSTAVSLPSSCKRDGVLRS